MDIAQILIAVEIIFLQKQGYFADRGALRVFNICGVYKADENWSNQESELLAEIWPNVVCLLDPPIKREI